MGIVKASELIEKKLKNLGISLEVVESDYGKKDKWDITKLIQLSGALRSIEEGYEAAEKGEPREYRHHLLRMEQPGDEAKVREWWIVGYDLFLSENNS
jgi:hypothetical protein